MSQPHAPLVPPTLPTQAPALAPDIVRREARVGAQALAAVSHMWAIAVAAAWTTGLFGAWQGPDDLSGWAVPMLTASGAGHGWAALAYRRGAAWAGIAAAVLSWLAVAAVSIWGMWNFLAGELSLLFASVALAIGAPHLAAVAAPGWVSVLARRRAETQTDSSLRDQRRIAAVAGLRVAACLVDVGSVALYTAVALSVHYRTVDPAYAVAQTSVFACLGVGLVAWEVSIVRRLMAGASVLREARAASITILAFAGIGWMLFGACGPRVSYCERVPGEDLISLVAWCPLALTHITVLLLSRSIARLAVREDMEPMP